MRGQIFTTAASLKIGGLAAGTALAGLLAGRPVTGCLLIAAAFELCAAAVYLLAGSRRRASAGRLVQQEERLLELKRAMRIGCPVVAGQLGRLLVTHVRGRPDGRPFFVLSAGPSVRT
jgi:hypothetical protein